MSTNVYLVEKNDNWYALWRARYVHAWNLSDWAVPTPNDWAEVVSAIQAGRSPSAAADEAQPADVIGGVVTVATGADGQPLAPDAHEQWVEELLADGYLPHADYTSGGHSLDSLDNDLAARAGIEGYFAEKNARLEASAAAEYADRLAAEQAAEAAKASAAAAHDYTAKRAAEAAYEAAYAVHGEAVAQRIWQETYANVLAELADADAADAADDGGAL